MKSLNILFMLAMLMALAMAISATSSEEESMSLEENVDEATSLDDTIPLNYESQLPTSLRGASRILAQAAVPRANMTCNKYPRICHAKGSPGPDCCKKKCVDVKTDKLNCGMCGKKCKYTEICCKGKCVNPRSDKKHCGSCTNKCKKGTLCVYGMCSYA